MKLYNSLTKNLEEFIPLKAGEATIYSCGPTVYNNLHIGNLSAFIFADILRRALQVNGYATRHVMNITDIDDKTIRDSAISYPDLSPMDALTKLTSKYTKIFLDDLKSTGNALGEIEFISAVDTTGEMIDLVQVLLDNEIAYATEDGIYFSIESYIKAGHEYGILQHVEVAEAQSRIANDEYGKDNASDFALWKAKTAGEPSWDAEFKTKEGTVSIAGRPGWHIECSAMSQKLLGVPLDIHTGGIDLKFPHHENEIAQSCGAGANKLANYFIHNNHILVDGRKMSKSLNNFYTLRDLETHGFNPQDFRMLVLESHYRSESNFSWEILAAAKNRRQKICDVTALVWQPLENAQKLDSEYFTKKITDITLALSDDIATPQVLTVLSQLTNDLENTGIHNDDVAELNKFIQFIEHATGLQITSKDITDAQKDLLQTRAKAREDKDFTESDRLRDVLKSEGIELKDSTSGQVWSRIL